MDPETTIVLDSFMPASELVILTKGKFFFVPFRDIIRISKKGNEVSVVTAAQTYLTTQTMEAILRELPVNQFARVQKSMVISLEHWDELKKTIRITGYYRKELKKKLAAMLEQQYRSVIVHSTCRTTPK